MTSLYFAQEKHKKSSEDDGFEDDEEEDEVEEQQQRPSSGSSSSSSSKSSKSSSGNSEGEEALAGLPPRRATQSVVNDNLEEGEPGIDEQIFMKQNEGRLPPVEPRPINAATAPKPPPQAGALTRPPRAPHSHPSTTAVIEDPDSVLDADVQVVSGGFGSVASGTHTTAPNSLPGHNQFGGEASTGESTGGGSIPHSPRTDRDSTLPNEQEEPQPPEEVRPKSSFSANDRNLSSDSDSTDGSDEGGSKCNLVMILAVLCCVGIVAGIGAALGVVLSGKNDNNTDGLDGTGPMPPITTVPTIPKPTPPPTKAPTPLPTPVPPALNDECTGATILMTGIEFVSTTVPASTVGEVGVGDIETSCGGREGDGPGIWFVFEGTGLDITVSTCGEETVFDTKLGVFTGSCESGALTCIATNDDFCGVASSVTWKTEPGENYFILLRGFREGQGTFRMTVTESPPANDSCLDAILLEPTGEIYLGNSAAATIDPDVQGVCGDSTSVEITGPGVWFKVEGTGGELIASTCSRTTYDTKLAVFTGRPGTAIGASDEQICASLTCVAFNDDSCGLKSEVKFESEAGQMYFLLLHGYLIEAGEYGIAIATEDNLYNNYCGDAREAKIGIPIQGYTTYADFDFEGPVDCGTVTVAGPSVWYTVYGTGTPLLISTCSPNTNFDTQVSIFTGGCSSLFCVGGNDDSDDETCGGTSEFVWPTEAFTEYNIIVHGFGNSTGEFELLIEALGERPALDDPCKAIGPVPFNWDPVVGSTATLAGIGENVFDCVEGLEAGSSSPSVQGEWYFVVSDGGLFNVSVCENSISGTRVAVFQAEVSDCASLECGLGGIEYGNACAFSWDTIRNTAYHILVYTPPGTTGGVYGMTVTSTGPPPVNNDDCTIATALEIGGVTPTFGTTHGATVGEDTFCGVEATAPSVWFSVVGNGDRLIASLCGSTDFDSKMSVYSSSDGTCATLECLGGDDDSCELQSSYSWQSRVDVTYYIMIHGFGDTTGDYGITVTSLA